MSDKTHIKRLRRAMDMLRTARNYESHAQRLVKQAEAELKAAITASMETAPPAGGGERKAA